MKKLKVMGKRSISLLLALMMVVSMMSGLTTTVGAQHIDTTTGRYSEGSTSSYRNIESGVYYSLTGGLYSNADAYLVGTLTTYYNGPYVEGASSQPAAVGWVYEGTTLHIASENLIYVKAGSIQNIIGYNYADLYLFTSANLSGKFDNLEMRAEEGGSATITGDTFVNYRRLYGNSTITIKAGVNFNYGGDSMTPRYDLTTKMTDWFNATLPAADYNKLDGAWTMQGTTTIRGGSSSVTSGNSDYDLTVTGGSVTAKGTYDGLTVSGGSVTIGASTKMYLLSVPYGTATISGANVSATGMTVSGGTLIINGDGTSATDMIVSGGTLNVNRPTSVTTFTQSGGATNVANSSVINLNGAGNISNGTMSVSAGSIGIRMNDGNSTLNVTGGQISGGGTGVDYRNGSMTVSGSPRITSTTGVSLVNGKYINVNGDLTNGEAQIGVTTATEPNGTSQVIVAYSAGKPDFAASDYACFYSDKGFTVTTDAVGEIVLNALPAQTWTVTYPVGQSAVGFTVTPYESTATVHDNGSFSFYVTPADGYTITAVTGHIGAGNAAVLTAGANGVYTINNITDNTAIDVTVTKQTYAVSYNNNGGSGTIGNSTKIYGETLTLSDGTGFSKTGYKQTGWAVSTNGTASYGLGGAYTENGAITLYAVWQPNDLTVTYKNGATEFGKQAVQYGVSAALSSAIPTGTGTFVGWDAGTDGVVDYVPGQYAAFTTNVTLTAVFKTDLSVTYAANTTDTVTNLPETATVAYDATYTISSAVPSRTGYTFTGYLSNGGATYQPGNTISHVTAAITLTAQWMQKQYTVSTDVGTGFTMNPSQTVNSGATATVTLTVATGYTQSTPVVKANGVVLTGTGTNPYTYTINNVQEDKVITVEGIVPDTYAISYTLGGGMINEGAVYSYTYGVGATLPTNVTREGYTFAGWKLNNTGDVVTAVTTTDTGDRAYTAQWTQLTYDVSLSADTTGVTVTANGTTLNAATPTVLENVNYGNPVTITVTGGANYNVSNMIVTANGVKLEPTNVAGKTYTYLINHLTEDTVIAVTQVIAIYTMSYDDNHTDATASRVPQSQSGNEGTELTVSSYYPKRDGYTFEGWATDEIDNDVVYLPGDTLTLGAANITLYAVWETVDYNISYVLNGGIMTDAAERTYTIETETFDLPTPTRTGYNFAGWFTTSNFAGAVVTEVSKGNFGDKTFYAMWTEKTPTVTFNPTTGCSPAGEATATFNSAYTFTVTVDKDYTQTAPVVIVNNGINDTLVCTGVTDGADGALVYSYSYFVNTDAAQTISVAVEPNVYTVTYMDGNVAIGTLDPKFSTYTYGVAQNLPTTADLTKVGKTLEGWYTDAALTNAASITELTSGNQTFYAKWTNALTVTVTTNGAATFVSQIPNFTGDANVSDAVTVGDSVNITFAPTGTNALDKNSIKVYTDVTNQIELTDYLVTENADETVTVTFAMPTQNVFIVVAAAGQSDLNVDWTAPTGSAVAPVVSYNYNGTTGTWTYGDADTTIPVGADVTLSFTVNAGYQLAKNLFYTVDANDAPVALSYTKTQVTDLDGNVTYTMTFKMPAVQADITLEVSNNYSLGYVIDEVATKTYKDATVTVTGYDFIGTTKVGAATIKAGAGMSFTVAPAAPNELRNVYVTYLEDGATKEIIPTLVDDTYSFNMPAANATIHVDLKDQTTTTLTADLDEQAEKATVILTATVLDVAGHKQGNQGTINFYYTTEEPAGTVTLNQILAMTKIEPTTDVNQSGQATISFELKEYSEAANYYFFAIYSGSDYFLSSFSDTAETVNSLSTAIAWTMTGDTANRAVTINEVNADGTTGAEVTSMDAGYTYLLTAPTVCAEDDDTALTVDTDYRVVWFYADSEDTAGDNWQQVGWTASNLTSIKIAPEYVNYSYKALIYPTNVDGNSVLSRYNKAVRYNTDGTVINDVYALYLETDSTNKVARTATETVLAITDTTTEAAGTVGITGAHETQYEGQTVTLTATVTENGTPVTTGYVNFYQNGTLKAHAELAESNQGIVSAICTISPYDTGKTAANNSDSFYVEYVTNDTYDTSVSAVQTVYIKSASIDTPVIHSSVAVGDKNYTTKTADLAGLPTNTTMTFTLVNQADAVNTNEYSVVAKDGRAVAASEFTMQWQISTDSGANYRDLIGMQADAYLLHSGQAGEQYRIVLTPAADGNMNYGSASNAAVIGEKQGPGVTLVATTPYTLAGDAFHTLITEANFNIAGSHFGDEVTLTTTVTGTVARPTGYVQFYYTTADGNTNIGDPVALGVTSNDYTATASIQTTALPIGLLTLGVNYLGDTSFNPANMTRENYKVWSVNISNGEAAVAASHTEQNYGLVTISAYRKTADGYSDTAETGSLTAEQTYKIVLGDIYTKTGEKLVPSTDFTVLWEQSSDAGITWQTATNGTPENNNTILVVKPETTNLIYRAKLTTTDKLYSGKYAPSLVSVEYSNTIGATTQAATVAVTASDEITGVTGKDVYQSNPITLTATVSPDANGNPSGYVKFYYAVADTASFTTEPNWVELVADDIATDTAETGKSTAQLKAVTQSNGLAATMQATLTTSTLPVAADGRSQKLIFKAEYLGDGTFAIANNLTTGVDATIVASDVVTIYSSVPYVNTSIENNTIADAEANTLGIVISTADDILKADGSNTTLTLKDIYTRDGYTPAAEKTALDQAAAGDTRNALALAKLTAGVDYTVTWQICENYGGTANEWKNISGFDNQMIATVNPASTSVAYRAMITVLGTAATKAASLGGASNGLVRATYYSNILTAVVSDARLAVDIAPGAAVEGDTLTFNVNAYGGIATPTGSVTMLEYNFTTGNWDEVIQTGTTSGKRNLVNGATSFTVENAVAGTHTYQFVYNSNNNYQGNVIVKDYIVRYANLPINIASTNPTYDGQMHAATVSISGIDNSKFPLYDGGTIDVQGYADAHYSVAYTKNGVATDVPMDAGSYDATVELAESLYYVGKTATQAAAVTVEQRAVSVADVTFQQKTYDGSANVNVAAIELSESTVNAETGLPTNSTGVIRGDVVYATATVTADSADAGSKTFAVAPTLMGDDAANYILSASSYDFAGTIYRSQLYGSISETAGAWTEANIKILNESGAVMAASAYNVLYYYHAEGTLAKVSGITKDGTYTVVVQPVSTTNFKGGAAGQITVVNGAATVAANPITNEPVLINITNTAQIYDGSAKAVTVTPSGAVVTYSTENPTEPGRYGVAATVTDTNGNTYTASSILTIYKATATYAAPAVENKTYDGGVITVTNAAEYPAGTYFTYTGGRIFGVSYDAPKDAGTYTVTAHIPADNHYAAATVTSTFTIAKKTLTATPKAIYNQQYVTTPSIELEYTGFVTGDSIARDILYAPSYAVHAVDGNNSDYNFVGNFTVGQLAGSAYNGFAYNYALDCKTGELSVINQPANEKLQIWGVAEGDNLYYGDTLTLWTYGNRGYRNGVANDNYVNDSSVIRWSVAPSDGFVGTVTIGKTSGELSINGVGSFTVTATRGTSNAITTSITLTSQKKVLQVVVAPEDYVYNNTDRVMPTTNVSYIGLVGTDTITTAAENITYSQTPHNVGAYLATATIPASNNFYTGSGTGLVTIHHAKQTVTAETNTKVYGIAKTLTTFTEAGTPVNATALGGADYSDIKTRSDVGSYVIYTAGGTQDANFIYDYVKGAYAQTATAVLDILSGEYGEGSDFAAAYRMYGNVIGLNYQVLEIVDGDTLADFNLSDTFLFIDGQYIIPDEDSVMANHEFNSKTSPVGNTLSGKPNAYDIQYTGVSNLNSSYPNYTIVNDEVKTVSTDNLREGTLQVYQRPITLNLKTAAEYTVTAIYGEKWSDVYDRLLDLIQVGQFEGIGGLAEAYGHTIDDLNISFKFNGTTLTKGMEGTVSGTQNLYNVTIVVGNPNYKLMNDPGLKVDLKWNALSGVVTWSNRNRTMTVRFSSYEQGVLQKTGVSLDTAVTFNIYAKSSYASDFDFTTVKASGTLVKKTDSNGTYYTVNNIEYGDMSGVAYITARFYAVGYDFVY